MLKSKKNNPPKPFVPAPSQLARCRAMAGDVIAGILLYRIVGLWKKRQNKLQRHGMEWIAMSRAHWALSAGLTENELKDRALPRLKKACGHFLTFKTMRLDPTQTNMIWISVNELLAQDGYEVMVEQKAEDEKLSNMTLQ